MEHFDQFGLDPRLVRALATSLKIAEPTPVQGACIPIALQGKDILARAKTGSGKTLAYLLPVIHKILLAKARSDAPKATRALVVVPTRELAHQVSKTIKEITVFCKDLVKAVNISTSDASITILRPLLQEIPDIIITTPTRILQFLTPSTATPESTPLISLKPHLESLVLDESDLLLSYGTTDADIRQLLSHTPPNQSVQTFLISATLNDDVSQLKQMVLRNPAILTVEEDDESSTDQSGLIKESVLTQYKYTVSANTPKEQSQLKHLIVYFLLKLRVAPFGTGKTIIFVNSVDSAYRLKLFLEAFGVRSCVVNEEVPVRSRVHVVEEFNRGVFDLLIATDGSCEVSGKNGGTTDDVAEGKTVQDAGEDTAQQDKNNVADARNGHDHDNETNQDDQKGDESTTDISPESSGKRKHDSAKQQLGAKKLKKGGGPSKDSEYGMSRGIDFRNVSSVINFDLPATAAAYQHRIGRTARGIGKRGWALSFVCDGDLDQEDIWKRIEKKQNGQGHEIQSFKLDMPTVLAFQYRTTSALTSITKPLIKQARLKELKAELLNSDKLKAHFEDHQGDLLALKHDKVVFEGRVVSHLKHVPDYLVPKGKKIGKGEVGANKHVPFHGERGRRGGRGGRGGSRGGRGGRGTVSASSKRKADPLKSFKI